MIDLLNGNVVHAKNGDRSNYIPISSSLTTSTNPLDIVKAFMDIFPFKTLYIADLNAIQGMKNTNQNHMAIIEEIHHVFPSLMFWIDAGIYSVDKVQQYTLPYARLVLGSESFSTLSEYCSLTSKLNQTFSLSLDFLPDGYKGPEELLNSNQYWPTDIIVMTLKQVGSNTGIDQETVANIVSKSTSHHIYAAGGIRHIDDLNELKKIGVKGALIASALHYQQLKTKDLDSLTQ